MPNYDFKKDLPVAKQTEKEVAEILKKNYKAVILGFNDDNKYDILTEIEDEEKTFEVKEDFLCEFTGNVGLEFECRGKISGIQTSKADYYLYKLHTKNGIQYVVQDTSALKEKIKNKEYFRIVNGGDKGSNSMNYLFKYDVFVRDAEIFTS